MRRPIEKPPEWQLIRQCWRLCSRFASWMVFICSLSFFMIALKCICKLITRAPFLGHFGGKVCSVLGRYICPLSDIKFSWSILKVFLASQIMVAQMIVAGKASVLLLYSWEFPQFIVALKELCDGCNYCFLRHCLDYSTLRYVSILSLKMG